MFIQTGKLYFLKKLFPLEKKLQNVEYSIWYTKGEKDE